MYYFITTTDTPYANVLRTSEIDNLTAGGGEQKISKNNIGAYRNPEDYCYGSVETDFVLKTAISSVDAKEAGVVSVLAMAMDVYLAIKLSWSQGMESISLSGLAGKDDNSNFVIKLPDDYVSGGKVRYNIATYATTDQIRLDIENGISISAANETGLHVLFDGSGTDLIEKWTDWVEFDDTNFEAGIALGIHINRDADHADNEYNGSCFVVGAEFKYNY